jgi:hypothetical protein
MRKDEYTNENGARLLMEFCKFDETQTGPERLETLVVGMARFSVRSMLEHEKNSSVVFSAVGRSRVEMHITIHTPAEEGGAQ